MATKTTFKLGMRVDDSEIPQGQIVRIASFPISRNGKHTGSITFYPCVTVKKAIENIESYLSYPVNQAFYDLIKDDLYEPITSYKCRGDCLTDYFYIEGISVDDEGIMTLTMGN